MPNQDPRPDEAAETDHVYEKPAIAWEQQLDVAAIGQTCAKGPSQSICQLQGVFS